MAATLAQLDSWLNDPEDEHLEVKEARNRFDFEELVRYCAALANEGGGTMLLGVGDRRPRRIVGTQAFAELERTKAGLVERLRLRIEATALTHPDGRVLVFTVPPRPIGMPIEYKGAYWMRAGESLVPMTPDLLKRIFDEAAPDFSAEVCAGATLADLDPAAIETFRAMWLRKSGNAALAGRSHEQLLRDAELLTPRGLTYAALILLGTRAALGEHLAQAEVIFEYRDPARSPAAQQREEYRRSFLTFHDALWGAVDARNPRLPYQDRLFVGTVPAFNEVVVREAILNAVAHRDYRLGGSVFVRQTPERLEIVSPGGFPAGVTPENILERQAPRNRRLAEAFARCGLVERAGQGADRMFAETIREAKPLPDFADSDAYQVALRLRGEIADPRFLNFLYRVGQQPDGQLQTDDLLVLDRVRRGEQVPGHADATLARLHRRGIIEREGRGTGVRYVLSPRFYEYAGAAGARVARGTIARAKHKALLLERIAQAANGGIPLQDLLPIIPALAERSVQRLLAELAAEGSVHSTGRGRAARWFPGEAEAKTKADAG